MSHSHANPPVTHCLTLNIELLTLEISEWVVAKAA